MNLPDKLPRVVGEGQYAQAFALMFERFNQLRDYCESITPHEANSTRINRTKTGTTIEAEPPPSGSSGTGSGEARWA